MLEKSCTFRGENHPTSSMEMPWWRLTLGQLWPKVMAWWNIKFSSTICHPFEPCGLMRPFRRPMTDGASSSWWVRLLANIGILWVYRRVLTVMYEALSHSTATAKHTKRYKKANESWLSTHHLFPALYTPFHLPSLGHIIRCHSIMFSIVFLLSFPSSWIDFPNLQQAILGCVCLYTPVYCFS